MGKRTRSMLAVAAVVWILAAGAAAAQEPVDELNAANLVAGFVDGRFWLALLATVISGAVGGLVYELLILQGNIELPHKPAKAETSDVASYALAKNMIDLGIWARVIIGGLGAVAALLVLRPDSTFGLLATGMVAGSAGTSIFRSLQDRFTASIAQYDAAAARSVAEKQHAALGEAAELLAAARGRMVVAPELEGIAPRDVMPSHSESDDLADVEKLLHEARGYYQAL